MGTDRTVEVVAVAIVVPLVLGWLSRAGGLGATKPGELRYSQVFRWFALVITLGPPVALLAVATLLIKKPLGPNDQVPFVLLMVFFPLLGSPLLVEFFRVRHLFDDAGVTVRSPWTKHRYLAWSDVSALKWRKVAKSFDLKTRNGTTVHVSPWLSGLQPFADVALARIPPTVLGAHAEGRAVLQLMSAGRAGALMTDPLPPEQMLAAVMREPRV